MTSQITRNEKEIFISHEFFHYRALSRKVLRVYKAKLKLPPLIILLAFMFSVFVSPSYAFQGTTLNIYGFVKDYRGIPIPNATLVILDWTTLQYRLCSTDAKGYYSLEVPHIDYYGTHQYIVYALHFDNNGTIDYVPAVYPTNLYDPYARITTSREVSFQLFPGASITVKGSLWYVLSSQVPRWYTLEVIDATTGGSYIFENSIPVFGNPPYRYGIGCDVRFIPQSLINRQTVVIPADKPTYILVKAEFFNDRTNRFQTVSFLIGSEEGAFTLRKGERATMDISVYSATFNLEVLLGLVKEIEGKITEAERVGFFVGGERDDLRKIGMTLSRAQANLPPVNPNPDEDTLRQTRFLLLEKSYNDLKLLERRVDPNTGDMYVISQSHSVFFPPFFAVFAVILASFLFENNRRKIATSMIIYPLMIVGLYFVYPGVKVIFNTEVVIGIKGFWTVSIQGGIFFFSIVILAIIASLLAFFLFPKVYREPIVEGRAPLTSVLSTIFSIGKRNVKRRKLRSSLAIIAIMILITGFTALTSLSWIYGLVKETPKPVNTSAAGVLIMKIPSNETRPHLRSQLFNSLENASLFDYGALSLVPKVENIPSPDPVLFVKASKSAAQPLPIYGVLGIAPSLEEGLTGLGRFIIGGELRDDDEEGVVMSRKLADALGVRIGGTIEVYRSDMSVVKNFTLRAFLEDGFFESLDLDGNSLPPSKLKGSDIVKTNQTETLLFTPKAALKIYEEEKSGIGISRIFVKLSSTSEETLSEFAQAMVHKGYTAWVFRNGMATKYYIGSVFKVEGLEQFLIPFVLVVLNVSLVMMNLLHERAKEVSILSMVGLNPGHIATVFMAESIVMGLVGGGLGYFLGLGMYRLMSFLSPESQIAVREKLEWYWGVVSIAIALLVAVVSAIRPAIKAAMLATPSMVRKMKVTQEERLKRDKEIFKVYLGREFGLPIRVHEREEPFFSSYLTDRLRELMTGLYDRVEEFSLDEQVLADGTRVKRFLFNYIIIEGRNQYTTVNEIIARKKPQTDFYTLSLLSKPKSPGLPEHITETTLTLVKDLVLDWDREKGRIIGKI